MSDFRNGNYKCGLPLKGDNGRGERQVKNFGQWARKKKGSDPEKLCRNTTETCCRMSEVVKCTENLKLTDSVAAEATCGFG